MVPPCVWTLLSCSSFYRMHPPGTGISVFDLLDWSTSSQITYCTLMLFSAGGEHRRYRHWLLHFGAPSAFLFARIPIQCSTWDPAS